MLSSRQHGLPKVRGRLDILSNASGVTSHLLMGRSRATEMNLSRDRCHPSAFKKEECDGRGCFLLVSFCFMSVA